MRLAIWPNAAQPWPVIRDEVKQCEASGWDTAYIADHFMPSFGDDTGPTSEAVALMAGLAAATDRIRIGSLVFGNTYRHPAVLTNQVATIDHLSGGRVLFGLGAGWQENEHQKYGIEFHTLGGRMSRLEEAAQVVTSLLANDRTTFAGNFYQLDDAPLVPRPVQSPLPLLIGGGGEKRTLRITAQYANEWNVWGTPETLRQKMAILDQHCAGLGRNPKDIQRSAVALLFLSDDPAVVERAKGAGRPVIAGNVAEVRATIQAYIDAGVDEVIIPDFTLGPGLDRKTEAMDRFTNEVASAFR